MVLIDREMNAGIEFLEFKPSEIAAAVAISVAGEGEEETAIPLLIQPKLHMVISNVLFMDHIVHRS